MVVSAKARIPDQFLLLMFPDETLHIHRTTALYGPPTVPPIPIEVEPLYDKDFGPSDSHGKG